MILGVNSGMIIRIKAVIIGAIYSALIEGRKHVSRKRGKNGKVGSLYSISMARFMAESQ